MRISSQFPIINPISFGRDPAHGFAVGRVLYFIESISNKNITEDMILNGLQEYLPRLNASEQICIMNAIPDHELSNLQEKPEIKSIFRTFFTEISCLNRLSNTPAAS